MAEPESTPERRAPDAEMQVAAAAIAAAISPPLGVAVAAGSALRSRRVRQTLRKGTVNALANAMELSDKLAAVAARTKEPSSEPPVAQAAQDQPPSQTTPSR